MVYKSTHTNNDNYNPLLNDIKFSVQMFDSVLCYAFVMLLGMHI